jgi:hypothetical protein
MFGKCGEAIKIIREVDDLVANFAKPHLSRQVSQNFSYVPVLLRLCGRRKILDHVDFPQSTISPEKRG